MGYAGQHGSYWWPKIDVCEIENHFLCFPPESDCTGVAPVATYNAHPALVLTSDLLKWGKYPDVMNYSENKSFAVKNIVSFCRGTVWRDPSMFGASIDNTPPHPPKKTTTSRNNISSDSSLHTTLHHVSRKASALTRWVNSMHTWSIHIIYDEGCFFFFYVKKLSNFQPRTWTVLPLFSLPCWIPAGGQTGFCPVSSDDCLKTSSRKNP